MLNWIHAFIGLKDINIYKVSGLLGFCTINTGEWVSFSQSHLLKNFLGGFVFCQPQHRFSLRDIPCYLDAPHLQMLSHVPTRRNPVCLDMMIVKLKLQVQSIGGIYYTQKVSFRGRNVSWGSIINGSHVRVCGERYQLQ